MLLLGGCAAAECGVSDAAAGLTGVAELVSLEVVSTVNVHRRKRIAMRTQVWAGGKNSEAWSCSGCWW